MEYGLPVRRVGGETGSVFAYVDELDLWMKSGRRPSQDHKDQKCTPILIRPATAHGEYRDAEESFAPIPILAESKEQASAFVALGARIWRVLSFSNLRELAHAYRQAIDHDCANPYAFAGLSSALTLQALLGELNPETAYTAAKAALHRAAELAPELPEVICEGALIKILLDRDWQGARDALGKAGGEKYLTSRIQVGLGLLSVAQGLPEEANALFHSACQQSALNVVWRGLHLWSAYLAGDYHAVVNLREQHRTSGQKGSLLDAVEALALLQVDDRKNRMSQLEALAVNAPHNPLVRGVLGYANAINGKVQNAQNELEWLLSARAIVPNHYAIALILIGLNKRQEAIERLQQSYREGSLWSLGFESDPILQDQDLTHLGSSTGYRVRLSG